MAQFVENLEGGGAEALALGLAAAFAERGDEGHLIVLDGGGPLRDRVADAVRFHDLQRPRIAAGQAARLADFAGTSGRLADLLRAERIDVLQTHLPKANFLGLAAHARRCCPVLPTIHNNREFEYGDDPGPLKLFARRSAYRLMARHCAGMVAVSDRVKESLVAELGLATGLADRISVVPNGVAVPELPTPDERDAARRRWGVGDDEVLLVALGRLTGQKNYGFLVEALADVSHRRSDWRCVIAGDGELRADLEKGIDAVGLGDRIVLAGFLSETRPLLAAADVFCLPSLYEGLPLALLEAMAHGLPAVATRIDGVGEVVREGKEGRLAAVGDVAGLAGALEGVMAEREARMEMGRAARRLVEDRYGFARVVERLDDVYRDAGVVSGEG